VAVDVHLSWPSSSAPTAVQEIFRSSSTSTHSTRRSNPDEGCTREVVDESPDEGVAVSAVISIDVSTKVSTI
ncbi:uncharacterized protein METZ01_LOCUS150143, partial [marine metagenome]